MPSTLQARAISTVCGLLLWPSVSLAHMEMDWPYALHSKYNPRNDFSIIDYSMTSPLNADGTNFPCKGYQNDRPFQSVATYTAGSSYNISLAGSATHGGGSCQISLSYDNGATFRVIKSIIGGCPLSSTYDFKVPSYAPSGNALLSWTWQNHEGNREFYQNCAQVSVQSSPSRRLKRQSFNSFDSLPFIWKANLDGVNDCATTEGNDPVYPNPGPDVVYGAGLTASSASSPGTCDWPTPYGTTYKDLGDSDSVPDGSDVDVGSQILAAVISSASYRDEYSEPAPLVSASATRIQERSASITAMPTAKTLNLAQKAVSVQDSATITVTVSVDYCPSATLSMLTTTRKPLSTSSPVVQPEAVPYATGDVNARYLPCVPGSFLCTSSTTFFTCNCKHAR